jgi:hypothetical protein
MTMVERVAAAIDPGAWADDLPVPTRADTEAFHRRRQASAKLARAAILAMREPSDAMCMAAWDFDGGPSAMFRGMIDAALDEEKKDG